LSRQLYFSFNFNYINYAYTFVTSRVGLTIR